MCKWECGNCRECDPNIVHEIPTDIGCPCPTCVEFKEFEMENTRNDIIMSTWRLEDEE